MGSSVIFVFLCFFGGVVGPPVKNIEFANFVKKWLFDKGLCLGRGLYNSRTRLCKFEHLLK